MEEMTGGLSILDFSALTKLFSQFVIMNRFASLDKEGLGRFVSHSEA
jgi:hypothetical protein